MSTNTSRIMIQASANRVWDALTKPELVKQWQYGSDLITDWQVGSDIRFSSEWEGVVYEQWGKVLEVVPFSLLRYSLFAPRPGLEDKPENYFIMSYVLNEEENRTLLTIEQQDNRPETGTQESNEDESQSVLSALKAIVEAN
ncbi:SRPBCC family protein [Paenibacillus solisilvae]|uniref:SRPBCC family protein n=1 Tax=Paenibacillus solisilvae TaxID=2486751 RepID=A0ABW0VZR2_9BACL